MKRNFYIPKYSGKQCLEYCARLHLKPALADSSIVMGIKEVNDSGLSSVVIDDDSYEGKSAYLVLLNVDGKVIYQTTTVVGGEV